MAMPDRADRAARLSMEPRPFGVEEHRVADFDLDIAVAHWIVSAHPFADPLRPARDHTKADPVTEHRRERDRGRVALIVLDCVRRTRGQKMCARTQPRLAIDRTKAHERRPVFCKKRRTLRHRAADTVLLRGYQLAEAEIACGQLPVDLVARHVSLFDAHYAERLGAIRRDAELLARRHDGADERIAIARR